MLVSLQNSELFAIIDDSDSDLVLKYNWKLTPFWGNEKYSYITSGQIMMHRLIMNFPGSKMVDHKNHNTLDNRRNNLRICTNSENQANAKRRTDNKTGYKGVSIDNDGRRLKYRAGISINGKRVKFGSYATAEDAARAYDSKAKEIYKEFAVLNFD